MRKRDVRKREGEEEEEEEKRNAKIEERNSGSKQRDQSSLNELLIIWRTRESGKGNWPYNGGAKCAELYAAAVSRLSV